MTDASKSPPAHPAIHSARRRCAENASPVRRDTASMPLITPRSKFPALKSASISAQIFSQPACADLGVDAAVGNDLDIAVGEQQIDQHAVVVGGVPDPQMRENIQRPLPRRLIRETAARRRARLRRRSGPGPECVASPALIACSIAASTFGGKDAPHPPAVFEQMPADAPDAHLAPLPAPRRAAAAETAAAAAEAAAAAARTAAAGP